MSEGEASATEPAASSLLDAMTSTAGYAMRTFGTAAGLRGLALETAWCTAHAASYPLGFWREHIRPAARPYRTDALSPEERGDLAADLEAPAGTPVLLVHGFLDNRSVFAPLRRALHRHGFGVTQAVNHGLFAGDVRAAARDLRGPVDRLRERTGADRIHMVGHSLGGLIARYFVQRLGGDALVDNLVTVGTPHGGSVAGYLLPTPVTRQVLPGSELLTELAEPAPRCRTRFLVVWSRMDQLIVPQTNGRLVHPDLDVRSLELPDVGHLSLAVHPRVVTWVTGSLARRDGTADPLEPEDDDTPRHLRPVGS